MKSLEDLFAVYCEDDDVMGVDGIDQFCVDIGVALEDPVMLVISYFLGAVDPAQYTREEFVGGLEQQRIDSIAKIQERLPEWRTYHTPEHPRFKEIFKYSFTFSSGGKKGLEVELAEELLGILLPRETHAHFCLFLNETGVKVLNLDQWMSFLEFSKVIGSVEENFSGYDVNDPWPILLDDYVTWAREQRAKQPQQQQPQQQPLIAQEAY
eukprot:CAMPEP_0201508110 /NCGR_PEP_ID=MMETSP0161_2-20130828/1561_1 /ASSEMBLY_ACC=CAM_ASM_000251 /TAXON_ID=180227 /ORGANISM="Neoparamoeba aestuarina, Strain SoJaBio B1-5/56/2" /LENGTH=209 /DNA_ID=CAMNT_0047902659 /DNA_START=172 /DNA_END=801 /DNA_ORIENTATION=-